jgi:transcriptional regulator with XRE-family HTH domain
VIGVRLREARLARQLSLNAVAQKADVSVATLSRIERDQQRIDDELHMTLMRILKMNAHDVLDQERAADDGIIEPIAARIATLPLQERTKLWRELAATRKSSRGGVTARATAQQVEEFLAQIDFLRGEIEAVRKKLR